MDICDRADAEILMNTDNQIASTLANISRNVSSRKYCVDCGEEIPAMRRKTISGCTRCVDCQRDFERRLNNGKAY